jgi:hypothetical protein
MKKWMAIMGLAGAIVLFGMAAVTWAEEKAPRKNTAKPDAGQKKTENGDTGEKTLKDNEITIIPGDRLKDLARTAPGYQVKRFRDSMPVVVPDSTIDYKILVMKPDPNIDYKIKNVMRAPRVLPRDIPKTEPKPETLPGPKKNQNAGPEKPEK